MSIIDWRCVAGVCSLMARVVTVLVLGEERTEANNFDYYETYFAGTQNILGSNDVYKSGERRSLDTSIPAV